jgi:hypothetical protein
MLIQFRNVNFGFRNTLIINKFRNPKSTIRNRINIFRAENIRISECGFWISEWRV